MTLLKTLFLLADGKQLALLQDPQAKYTIPLIEKEEITYDTRRFRFGLPTKSHVLGTYLYFEEFNAT